MYLTLKFLHILLAIIAVPVRERIPVTALAVLAALVLTGWTSARLGDAPRMRAVLRNVAGGAIAMAVTYGIGSAVGTQL